MVIGILPRVVRDTVTASGALPSGTHTPVNASSASKTMTLPTGVNAGMVVSVSKEDASANTVTVSGTISGGPVVLSTQYETVELTAETGGTSWRVTSRSITPAALSATYSPIQLAGPPNALTAAGTLVAGVPNTVSASTASFNVTLPTPDHIGQLLPVERLDGNLYTIGVVGTQRGVAGTTFNFFASGRPFESILFEAESLTSWRPIAGHKPKSWLDAIYATPANDRLAVVESIRQAASVYVDFTERVAYSSGVRDQWPGIVGGTAVDGQLTPGGTNALVTGGVLPLVGASVSGNTFPTGLQNHNGSATKTLLAWDSDSVTVRFTNVPSQTTFGGIRTLPFIAPGQTVELRFDVTLSDPAVSGEVVLHVNTIRTTDSVFGTEVSNLMTLGENPQTISARVTAPLTGSGNFGIVWLLESSVSTTGQQVTATLSNITAIPVPGTLPLVGEALAVPPYATAAVAASTITITIPTAGTYNLVYRTDEFGWAATNTTTTVSSQAVDLQTLLGPNANLYIRELYVIRATAWVTGWLDVLSPPQWALLRKTATRVIPKAALTRLTGAPIQDWWVLGSDRTYEINYDINRRTHVRVEVRNGDQAPNDAATGNTNERAEITNSYGTSVPFAVDVWTSYWVKIDQTLTSDFAIISQYRYRNNATGDDSLLSPEFALSIFPDNQIGIDVRSDGGTAVLTGSGNPTGITLTQITRATYTPGAWNRVLVRTVFSKTGGGHVQWWLNGTQIYNADVPVGYNRDVGPEFHYGVYKKAGTGTVRATFQHVESTTADLSSRLTSPLPI